MGDQLWIWRADHGAGAVAKQIAAPAGEQVEVGVALVVPDVRPLAADQADRVARVIGDHIALVQV